MDKIKEEILEVIKEDNGAFFGRIAMKVRHPKNVVLRHLLDLKSMGLLYKSDNRGKFKLHE